MAPRYGGLLFSRRINESGRDRAFVCPSPAKSLRRGRLVMSLTVSTEAANAAGQLSRSCRHMQSNVPSASSLAIPLWARSYRGDGFNRFYSVVKGNDGGYILAGERDSSYRAWLVKVDTHGAIVWQKTLGSGQSFESANSSVSVGDGYRVAGHSSVFGGSDTRAWLLKIDNAGKRVWQKTYGGTGYYVAASIIPASDGGFIVAGEIDPGVSSDIWLFKVDDAGNMIWQKTYGGPLNEWGARVARTGDGGYIVAAQTDSYGSGNTDVWVFKVDSSGNMIWQKAYGGPKYDFPWSIAPTNSGEFTVTGGEAGVAWVFNLNGAGDIVWQKSYGGREFPSIVYQGDSGYVVAGYGDPLNTGSISGLFLKLDSFGNITWQKTYTLSTSDILWSLTPVDGLGYVATGQTLVDPEKGADAWALKLDTNGELGGTCALAHTSSLVATDISTVSMDTSATTVEVNVPKLADPGVYMDSTTQVETQCSYEMEATSSPTSTRTPTATKTPTRTNTPTRTPTATPVMSNRIYLPLILR